MRYHDADGAASQKRPKAFHRIYMDFTVPVSILISCIFPLPVIHTLMPISPFTQSAVYPVLIRVDQSSRQHGGLYQRFDGCLLHIKEHLDCHLPAPLNHSENWRLLFFQCASATRSFQSVSAAFPSLGCHCQGVSFMSCHNIDFIKLHFVLECYLRFFLPPLHEAGWSSPEHHFD